MVFPAAGGIKDHRGQHKRPLRGAAQKIRSAPDVLTVKGHGGDAGVGAQQQRIQRGEGLLEELQGGWGMGGAGVGWAAVSQMKRNAVNCRVVRGRVGLRLQRVFRGMRSALVQTPRPRVSALSLNLASGWRLTDQGRLLPRWHKVRGGGVTQIRPLTHSDLAGRVLAVIWLSVFNHSPCASRAVEASRINSDHCGWPRLGQRGGGTYPLRGGGPLVKEKKGCLWYSWLLGNRH